MQRAVQASIEVIEGGHVLDRGMLIARSIWREAHWCAIGYNWRLTQQRGHNHPAYRKLRSRLLPKRASAYDMGKIFRAAETEYPEFKRLNSRCAENILKEMDTAVKSFMSNIKRGRADMRPPKPGHGPKTLTFDLRNMKRVGNWEYRLAVLGGTKGERHCTVRVHVRPGVKMSEIKILRITPEVKRGRYQASLIREVEGERLAGDGFAALDLGIINLGALAIDDGTTVLYSGRKILDIQRFGDKRAAKCKPSGYTGERFAAKPFPSKRNKSYKRKATNTIALAVHNFTTHVINTCIGHGVGTLAVGDLVGIRDGADYGSKTNQKLHRWPFAKIIEQLTWKGEEFGIKVVKISEAYTSQTCSACGVVRKSNRTHRGLYHCKGCGTTQNADVNGAINMLKKVSPLAVEVIGVGGVFPAPPSPAVPTSGTGKVARFANELVIVAKFDLRDYHIVTARNAAAFSLVES